MVKNSGGGCFRITLWKRYTGGGFHAGVCNKMNEDFH